MAIGEKRTLTEERIIEVEVPAGITLHLTDEEASCLADIFYRVGGNPETTRRGLVDGISTALSKAGAVRLNHHTRPGDIGQGMTFVEMPEVDDLD